ncbi:MAG: ribosomal protein S18-alanine N-acetyltransferase [Armatimonadota bacterium]|nr:ribosomal protein S18-alanine N-acetyltransferase [Armatimonadota bacterium]MCX7778007.1 ribosomal protein S18-alanine N-acetyltransferase [Armatimonadota bacterium]MDW8026018.1 ribosomal protein S18-alanine N-acetyltransferase [Armatimonadota bacterium]
MEGETEAVDGSKVTVELMQMSDLDEVMELEQLCFTQPWTRGMFESDLRQSELTYYIVARLKSRVIGYAGMWVAGGEAHITTIAVHPDFRRKGIGSRLMRTLLEEALRRGAKWAVLEVRQSNKAAQQLYKKWGFKLAGIRRHYYSNPIEDALIFKLPHIEEALKTQSETVINYKG